MGISDWFRRAKPETEPPADPILPEHRDTIDAVVSIFETGKIPGPEAYSTVTILPDGAGISYGLHQATARSGSLQEVIRDYYARGGSLEFGGRGAPLEDVLALASRSPAATPGSVSPDLLALQRALAAAGEEPVMREAQRHVFGRRYWDPTHAAGRALGLRYPLSYLALYDLSIHSGPPLADRPLASGRLYQLRQTFPEYPPSDSRTEGERVWVAALTRARKAWLEQPSQREIVRRSSYRCAALLEMMGAPSKYGLWELRKPFVVRGVRIS